MTWAKQSIIVAKTHAQDRDEAKGVAKGFADRLYTSRETSTSFRFRQKPPTQFVPGSYRVKSIPKKGVTIVYGQLKEGSAFFGGFEKKAQGIFKSHELPDNLPFMPPGSVVEGSPGQQPLPRKDPLVPPVSVDTQEGGPTGFRKEAVEHDYEPFIPAGSPNNPGGGAPGEINVKSRLKLDDVPPDAVPPVAAEPQNLNSFYTGFERKFAMVEKIAAKEHGMMKHKGKTIPREVKSLADRIRKDEPDRSDEYAYRTAWDIFRSHTAEGKQYPHKSPESGLKREGGGTGSLSKKGSAMSFEEGFLKRAASHSWPALLSEIAAPPAALGALAGAITGGEKDEYGNTYGKAKGVIRGATTGAGMGIGGMLATAYNPILGLPGTILGGMIGYRAGKIIGGKYDSEKRREEKTAFEIGFGKRALK